MSFIFQQTKSISCIIEIAPHCTLTVVCFCVQVHFVRWILLPLTGWPNEKQLPVFENLFDI